MKKYYLWTLGCQMNLADGERIAAVFNNAGILPVAKAEEADYIVILACSVRQTAIDRIFGKLKKWSQARSQGHLKLILSGCVLTKDQSRLAPHFDLIFRIEEIGRLHQFLNSTNAPENFFDIRPHYQSAFRAFVPISTGCNNFCAYCAVPYTRGREVSRPAATITAEIAGLVQKGYREITLLGQNVNSYGNDLGKTNTFCALLEEIDRLPGDFRVYFYSNHPKDMTVDLLKTFAKLNHFPHYLHLPLQSGSDRILNLMNRGYTQQQYLALVAQIKQFLPDVTLTTDIIVGFPGESRKDFEETKKVLQKVGFSMAFIAKYSPRPETASAKMTDNVSSVEKDRRFQILTKTLEEGLQIENRALIGQEFRVLVDEEKRSSYYGRTDSFKVVTVKKQQTDLLGRFVKVKILDSSPWMLTGTISP